MALSITSLRKGTIFQLDGVPYRVVEYSHKVMGRGGASASVKIKSLLDGKVITKTFHGNETVEEAEVANRPAQYLYSGAGRCHFMDPDSYDQFELDSSALADQLGYIKEGDQVTAQFFNDKIINIELPKNVPLKVAYTEAAVRGDTSTAITKDAQLETGLAIKVPAFIKTGDIISVDTATGAYRERQKD
ncbi:MAG TPA: elongation factor P [Candidatus Saccharimonadales bacterium]|nr:elongation factor P [Candidatus Saccharimonadales bacterium]